MKSRLLCVAAVSVISLFQTVSAGPSILSYRTPSYVEFQLRSVAVSSDETNVVLTVVRTGEYREQSSVEFQTVDGTAEGGVHFAAAGGTLVFSAGESFKSISIPLLKETASSNLTFAVTLGNPAPNCQITGGQCEVLLTNPPPRLLVQTPAAGQLVLSWSSAHPDLALERSSSPAGPWEPVPAAPVLKEERFECVEAAGAPHFYYRLRAK